MRGDSSGRAQIRTGDTRIFSPLLYLLSYPAQKEWVICQKQSRLSSPENPARNLRAGRSGP